LLHGAVIVRVRIEVRTDIGVAIDWVPAELRVGDTVEEVVTAV
jgi:hypothetical protein